jgi:hypothetical protein
MMERHYKPTGWLGLLLGTRLYFSFDDDAVATHEAFMQQIDLVERELGERGKVEATAAAAAAAAAAEVRLAPEGVPPPTLRSMEPTPEPAPAPAPVPAPRPRAAASSSATMTLSTPERTTSFTPSMRQQQPQQQQISAASPTMQQAITHQCGVADGSLLVETLQAQVKAHQAEASELRLEMERLRAEAAEAKLQALELRLSVRELTPTAAISEQRLAALQARLEALHKADLLGDDQLYMLEDVVADFVEFESAMGGAAVTLEAVHANENARNLLKLVKLVGLSERIASDDAFSRQVKRKCV